MNITSNRVGAIIKRHEELMSLVEYYIQETNSSGRRGDVRIYCDNIEEYVNTSCHCHPEYEWVDRGSVSTFCEWLNKRNGKTS